MHALQLSDIGRMAVIEMDDPEPGHDEVLIEIVATGICGSDIHGFTGENGRRVPGQVMGHESVGRVVARGSAAQDHEVGEVVTFNPVVVPAADLAEYAGREQRCPRRRIIGVDPEVVSGFAQLVAVPERNVVRLPAEMPIELGALIEPLAVAVHAVAQAQVTGQDSVLVLGGGPIGQSVVLALQRIGVSSIVVTEILPSRRDLVESLGAISVDPRDPDAAEQIRRHAGSAVHRAIDAVGISATFELALSATELGAVICVVGMGEPRISLDAFAVSTGERTLVGSFTYGQSDFEAAARWMGGAPAAAHRLISRQVPLSQGHAEFSALAAGHDTPGKVLVMLQDEERTI